MMKHLNVSGNESAVKGLILQDMIALQEERHEKYQSVLLSEWFPLTDLKTFTFIGGFTWTNSEQHKRWMAAQWVDNIGAGWCTPAEIARDYIRVKYKRQKATAKQKEAFSMRRFAPLYCVPGTYEDMTYFDLKAAYWTVIQTVGWDAQYFPNRWLGRRSFMNDFPSYKNKLARNCLVSVGLSTPIRAWTGEKLVFVEKANTMPNRAIWALCMDVLHGIADDMVKAGAVYVHTDGYILPTKNLKYAYEVCESWGVTGRVKDSSAYALIKATGSYDMEFTHDDQRKIRLARPFDNLVTDYKNFLKPRIRLFSETTPFIYG